MEHISSSVPVCSDHPSTEVEYTSESSGIAIGSNGDGVRTSTPAPRLSPREVSVSHQFLADLFRPHVRDYESMHLVLNHLGDFCDTCLLQTTLNSQANLGHTSQEMFRHCVNRLVYVWPGDERINPDIRQALRKFDWHALWNAVIVEAFIIRNYQDNPQAYGLHRRSGSQRWIIMSAAYADPADHTFAWDMMRYLEPIATVQASSAEFNIYTYQSRDITGEDVHWFSRSFFRHWDQAVQLLKQRHPEENPNDLCYILCSFLRLGMHVAQIFRKYWYQAPEDGSNERFAKACARAGKNFVDRQWRIDINSPFGCHEDVPVPLHIRLILAKCDYIRARRTFFATVSYLIDTTDLEDLNSELVKIMMESMKDWAVATGNEKSVRDAMNTFLEEGPSQPPSSAGHVPYNPWRGRSMVITPVMLTYDLPDDLPEDGSQSSLDSSEDDESTEDESDVQQLQPGRFRIFVNFLNPWHEPRIVSSFHLQDVELEAYGPKIDPQMVSRPCKPPEGDTCPICLEEFPHEQHSQETNTMTVAGKPSKQSRLSEWRPKNIRKRRQAAKESKTLQPMQFILCHHIFHMSCMKQLVNQPYSRTGMVLCPCCRVAICPSRPTRIARPRFRRIPIIGRLTRQ